MTTIEHAFSGPGYVYPLIPWSDPGVMIIFVLGVFAMLRWKNRVQSIATLTLLAAAAYVVLL